MLNFDSKSKTYFSGLIARQTAAKKCGRERRSVGRPIAADRHGPCRRFFAVHSYLRASRTEPNIAPAISLLALLAYIAPLRSVSAELTNQPTPAIFHRQSRCMAAGRPAQPAPLRNGDADAGERARSAAAAIAGAAL